MQQGVDQPASSERVEQIMVDTNQYQQSQSLGEEDGNASQATSKPKHGNHASRISLLVNNETELKKKESTKTMQQSHRNHASQNRTNRINVLLKAEVTNKGQYLQIRREIVNQYKTNGNPAVLPEQLKPYVLLNQKYYPEIYTQGYTPKPKLSPYTSPTKRVVKAVRQQNQSKQFTRNGGIRKIGQRQEQIMLGVIISTMYTCKLNLSPKDINSKNAKGVESFNAISKSTNRQIRAYSI